MATITNNLGLPDPIVRAITRDTWTPKPNRIGVTTLIAPPRKAALEILHADELVEDAADRVWALLGQAVHSIIERAGGLGIAEHRLTMDIEGWTLSGILDHFVYDPDGCLSDYKVSSTWAAKEGGKEEWDQQTNIYAHMLRHQGHAVARARVVLICRDWRKNEFLRYGSSGYPAQQVVVLPVTLWTPEQCDVFIRERMRMHQAARAGVLPHCTPEERWQRPTVWALMREGRKSAVKLYDNEAEADAAANGAKGVSVVKRPGIAMRCSQYCSVAKQCQAVNDGQWLPGEIPEPDATEAA
jgi:hypothetical protein